MGQENQQAQTRAGAQALQRLTQQGDYATVRQRTRQDFEQRRFSRAVGAIGADDAGPASGGGCQVNAMQHLGISEVCADVLCEEREDKDKDRERSNHKGAGKERDEEVDDGAAKLQYADRTLHLAKQLENLTGLEARVTILGHLQRGGTPSAADRILATRLGTACADLIAQGTFGVMVAARGEGTRPVPLEEVAGPVKTVPKDHPWILTARRVGTNLGD